ncbi:MAG: hypothetical protein JWN25_962 [Verrucomicrobiales bacterium]|nr:hypothetical protein [Verrucomicrobiales bacterium]MDB6130347.1 hypothetical protein [Verrucomicrobiales bacterium]
MFEQDHSQSGLFLYLCFETISPGRCLILQWAAGGLSKLNRFYGFAEEMENLSRKEWALNISNDS